MTLIAAYNHSGCGLVIGDILISGRVNEASRPQIRLPTQGNVSGFFKGSFGIRKPVQKVCIVSDDCAIAWAGRLDYARTFVSRLKRISGRIKITKNIIARLFQKCGYNDLQITGAIHEDGYLQTFGLNCEHLICPILGEIYAGGSGASAVHDYVRIVKEMNLGQSGEDEAGARGVSLALTQVAHLLNAEFRKGKAADSIREFFGGGYEIAAYYGGKFRKVSANFVFLDVGFQEGYLKIGYPTLVISQSYCGETLRYQVLSPSGPDNSRIRRNETIEIPPLVREADDHSAPFVGELTSFACFVFVDDFRFLGKQLVSTIVISDTPPFRYSVVNSKLNVLYSDDAERHIKKFLVSHYRSEGSSII